MPVWALCAAGLAAAPAVSAQEAADSVAAQEVIQDAEVSDSASGRPGPAGAFLRGVLLPGWGHSASGSLTRGAFYFSVESLAGWMLFKTARRLGAARERVQTLETGLTVQFERAGITEAEELAAALDDHLGLASARGLVAAREEQREDWAAVMIFTLLVSGVDAFVSAHLQDFPQPLTIEGNPVGDGGLELSFRVPLG